MNLLFSYTACIQYTYRVYIFNLLQNVDHFIYNLIPIYNETQHIFICLHEKNDMQYAIPYFHLLSQRKR